MEDLRCVGRKLVVMDASVSPWGCKRHASCFLNHQGGRNEKREENESRKLLAETCDLCHKHFEPLHLSSSLIPSSLVQPLSPPLLLCGILQHGRLAEYGRSLLNVYPSWCGFCPTFAIMVDAPFWQVLQAISRWTILTRTAQ